MYKWIDHIVVRVKDLEQGLADYEGKMGMKRREDPKEIPELGMKRAILPLGNDGRFIEILGFYDPRRHEERVDLERIDYWVSQGAQVSDRVQNLVKQAREAEAASA